MTRREELLELRDSMDIAREEFEENYAKLEEEIEQTCDCDNCACSDECDGEFDYDEEFDYDDMVTVAETKINDLGIWITEEEDGERFVMLTDLIDGERVEISEAELNVIVAMMGL